MGNLRISADSFQVDTRRRKAEVKSNIKCIWSSKLINFRKKKLSKKDRECRVQIVD